LKTCYVKKIQELEIGLYDSNTAREKEVLLNEIDTLKCVLGHLFNLKPGSDKIQAMGIAEAKNNYWQTNRLRKQLIEIQDWGDRDKRSNIKSRVARREIDQLLYKRSLTYLLVGHNYQYTITISFLTNLLL
jgi:hypothetical protein